MMDSYTIGTFLFGCCCALYWDIIDYKKHYYQYSALIKFSVRLKP